MRKLLLSLSGVTLLAIVFSFSPQTGTTKVAAAGATQQTVPVYYLGPDEFSIVGTVPDAYAKSVRNRNGISVSVHTSVTDAGAYTLWWVIFNHPENCTDRADTYPCEYDLPDIVSNATGGLSSGSTLTLSASVGVGRPYYGEVICPGILSGDCPGTGLTNPSGAVVQLVIRYHGPAIPGMIPEQLSTFLGGCPDGGPPCEDPQIVVFAP